MGEIQVQRTPELIAAEIRNIHSQTVRMVLYNAIEIGRRLVEAKSMVPHGEWGKWLEEQVNYSQSTANNFMRLFREYGSEQISLLGDANLKNPIFSRLSYSQAVALLALPEGEREKFVQENDIENMSTRELQAAIKAREDAEKKLNDALQREDELRKKVDEYQAAINKEKEAQKEAQAKVEELKSRIKQLKEEIENKEPGPEVNLELEREKIRSELAEQMKKDLEAERKKLQAEKDAISKEIETRDKRIKELEVKAATGANEDTQLFKVLFDQTVQAFDKLLKQLAKIEASDPEMGSRYVGAVVKALEKMQEQLTKDRG